MMRHWQIITLGMVVDVDEEQAEKIRVDIIRNENPRWIGGKQVYGAQFWIRSDEIIGFHESTPETRATYREYQKKLHNEESDEGWSE